MNDQKLQKQGGRITVAKADDACATAAPNQSIRMDAVLFGNVIRSGHRRTDEPNLAVHNVGSTLPVSAESWCHVCVK